MRGSELGVGLRTPAPPASPAPGQQPEELSAGHTHTLPWIQRWPAWDRRGYWAGLSAATQQLMSLGTQGHRPEPRWLPGSGVCSGGPREEGEVPSQPQWGVSWACGAFRGEGDFWGGAGEGDTCRHTVGDNTAQ